MKKLKNGDLVLQNVMVKFAKIDKPDTSEFGGNSYQVTAFMPKDSDQVKELKEVMQKFLAAKKAKIKDKKNNPLKDGDKYFEQKVEDYEADSDIPDPEEVAKKIEQIQVYKGHYMVRCSNHDQPKLLDVKGKTLDPTDTGLEGAIVNLHVSPWVYKKPTTGVKFFLNGVQVIEEGSFFGKLDSSEAFDVCPDEDEGDNEDIFDTGKEGVPF